jgi:hypothetical protein
MFLKLFKNFSAKRVLKKSQINVDTEISKTPIQTVGLLVDETDFDPKDKITSYLIRQGIDSQNIQILAYKNKYKKKETPDYPHFSKKDVTWLGSIENKEAKDFKQQPFDMLISYYDQKKTPLVIVTHKSKANFKVGFSSVDKRLNHFMIDTDCSKPEVFMDELFRYLKILNKI